MKEDDDEIKVTKIPSLATRVEVLEAEVARLAEVVGRLQALLNA